jgi:hypothetical protein
VVVARACGARCACVCAAAMCTAPRGHQRARARASNQHATCKAAARAALHTPQRARQPHACHHAAAARPTLSCALFTKAPSSTTLDRSASSKLPLCATAGAWRACSGTHRSQVPSPCVRRQVV